MWLCAWINSTYHCQPDTNGYGLDNDIIECNTTDPGKNVSTVYKEVSKPLKIDSVAL